MNHTIPLFKQYPKLAENVPYIALGSIPTPIQRLARLEKTISCECGLYVKRDDVSGFEYGGNKLRKLEFLLADAKKQGAVRVITSGGAGSNHALATAMYAKKVGLRASLLLFPQPNAYSVRENLLMDYAVGADIHYFRSFDEYKKSVTTVTNYYTETDDIVPYVIPPGGSSPIGVIGYVNAAFELKEQIDNGSLPAPDILYVALGTMGTAAGLLLGIKAMGLPCRIVAVRVVPPFVGNWDLMQTLFSQTNTTLRSADKTFPRCTMREGDLFIDETHFGGEYGLFTEESVKAVELLKNTDAIKLDGTYTGKAFAGFIKDVQDNTNRGKSFLFWNTKNSRPLQLAHSIDYHQLPESLHRYFIEPAQPMDHP